MELHTLLHPDIKMREWKKGLFACDSKSSQVKSRRRYIYTFILCAYCICSSTHFHVLNYLRSLCSFNGIFVHFSFYLDLTLLLPLLYFCLFLPRFEIISATSVYFRHNYCLNFDMVVRLIQIVPQEK